MEEKVWNGSQEDANRQTRTCAARHVAFRDKEQPRLLALTDSSFIDVFRQSRTTSKILYHIRTQMHLELRVAARQRILLKSSSELGRVANL